MVISYKEWQIDFEEMTATGPLYYWDAKEDTEKTRVETLDIMILNETVYIGRRSQEELCEMANPSPGTWWYIGRSQKDAMAIYEQYAFEKQVLGCP